MSPQASSKPGNTVEKHQLAGLDERERGFNRQVEIDRQDGAYLAVFRYEATVVTTETRETQTAALSDLVRILHEQGYQQLRSRLTFRGDAYLGSQEAWIEYPDQAWLPRRLRAVSQRLARLFRSSHT